MGQVRQKLEMGTHTATGNLLSVDEDTGDMNKVEEKPAFEVWQFRIQLQNF